MLTIEKKKQKPEKRKVSKTVELIESRARLLEMYQSILLMVGKMRQDNYNPLYNYRPKYLINSILQSCRF
jgi:hypothetical protein